MKFVFTLIPILAISFAVQAQPNQDSIAIVKLLETESATWRSGDVKAHADCWQIRPYSKIIVSTPDGKVLDVAPGMMTNPPAGTMSKGGSAVNTSYTMSISGNNAWVGHNETSTAADGSKSYSYEIRMLEKIKGTWKLVAQSIHLYKPVGQPPASN